MQEEIISYMRSVKKPMSVSQIAKAIGKEEIEVLKTLNDISLVCGIIAIPLDNCRDNSVYYNLLM